MIARLLGANWRTTISGVGTALFAGLTALAGLPYELGNVADILPPPWKPIIFKVSLVCTIALKIWNSVVQKDRSVTGGSQQQTLSGNLAKPGTQTLVDVTAQSTPASENK